MRRCHFRPQRSRPAPISSRSNVQPAIRSIRQIRRARGPTWQEFFGRKPGSVASFHYSPGYEAANFVWDEAHLDPYLTDPPAVIPGAIMLYKQKNADVRKAIIAFLKEQK